MTRDQALKEFKEHYLPTVPKLTNGKTDKVAVREAWGIYTDMLCRDNRISMKQYETWDSYEG